MPIEIKILLTALTVLLVCVFFIDAFEEDSIVHTVLALLGVASMLTMPATFIYWTWS